MDLNKLTDYERENIDKILSIEENMASEEDQKTIEDFFRLQWYNLDYETEKRPILVFSTPSQTGTDWFRLRVPLFNLWKKYADEYYIIYTDDINLNMLKFIIIVEHWVNIQKIIIE